MGNVFLKGFLAGESFTLDPLVWRCPHLRCAAVLWERWAVWSPHLIPFPYEETALARRMTLKKKIVEALTEIQKCFFKACRVDTIQKVFLLLLLNL